MLNKLIRLKTVMEMTGKSRSAIYADMKAGTFPQSTLLGARSVAWSEAAISRWIQGKIDRSETLRADRKWLKDNGIDLKKKKLEKDPLGEI